MSNTEWSSVRPVLVAIGDLYDEQIGTTANVRISREMVEERLGRKHDDPGIRAALELLAKSGYIEGLGADQEPFPILIHTVTVKGLRELRGWPSAPGESYLNALIDTLTDAINKTADPEEKSKLIQIRDGLAGIGRAVAVNLITQAATTGKLPGF